MRKRFAGIVATVTLISTPAMAQAGQPVRSSDAVVAANDTAASQGTTQGRQSGTSQGVARASGRGAGLSNPAIVGLGLGLTGVALATFVVLSKDDNSSSPR